jgi:hypothetical protein
MLPCASPLFKVPSIPGAPSAIHIPPASQSTSPQLNSPDLGSRNPIPDDVIQEEPEEPRSAELTTEPSPASLLPARPVFPSAPPNLFSAEAPGAPALIALQISTPTTPATPATPELPKESGGPALDLPSGSDTTLAAIGGTAGGAALTTIDGTEASGAAPMAIEGTEASGATPAAIEGTAGDTAIDRGATEKTVLGKRRKASKPQELQATSRTLRPRSSKAQQTSTSAEYVTQIPQKLILLLTTKPQ